MKVQLNQYQKYGADIKLGALESFATNEMVADKFRAAGFTNVVVTGTGNNRNATGVWSKPSQEAELPKQIVSVKEM